jgi:putative FmdB family regulatory protein
MPIYDYICTPCSKAFEKLVLSKSDEAEVTCPVCSSAEVSRTISRPAAVRTQGDAGHGSAPACSPFG